MLRMDRIAVAFVSLKEAPRRVLPLGFQADRIRHHVAYMKGHLRELIEGYGPLGILWCDGE